MNSLITPGLRTIVTVGTAGVAGDVVITSSATLQSVGLIASIAKNARLRLRAWVPVTVGATGGVRFEAVAANNAVFSLYHLTLKFFNTVAPSLTYNSYATPTAFTNAAANAGTHFLEVDAIVIASTAGAIDFQLAQNTSDSNSLTVLQGGTLEVTTF